MSIEFSCAHCGQKLRVSDDAGGKQAKCPKCSQVNEIPLAPTNADVELPPIGKQPPPPESGSPFSSPAPNPYSAPQAGYGTPSQSPFAGSVGNVPADIGSILNYATTIWQKHLGLLVGVTAVFIGVNFGFTFVSNIVQRMRPAELGVSLSLLISLVAQAVTIFLGIGYTRMALKMVRHQPVEFDELFQGGPLFLPVLGVVILYGLAVGLGTMLCIIPGIIIALLWWPCYYLVVDQKTNVMESFEVARTIMRGNMGTVFLVWLVGSGIALIGLLACGVGLLFAVPLVVILKVTAYLMMSDQLPLQPDFTAAKPFI